jgi:hypothetical protein
MNIIDLRKNLQRSPLTQSIADRRQVPYEFGSAEWWDYMKNNPVECPAFNRRKAERRTSVRQQSERRQYLAELGSDDKNCTRILLTPAERKLIEDLYLIDQE